jgi:hypothetical protein
MTEDNSKKVFVEKEPKSLTVTAFILSLISLTYYFSFIISPIAIVLALNALIKNEEYNIKWIKYMSIISIIISFLPIIYYIIKNQSMILGAALLILFIIISLFFFLNIKIHSKGKELTYIEKLSATITSVIIYFVFHFIVGAMIFLSHSAIHYGTPTARPKIKR